MAATTSLTTRAPWRGPTHPSSPRRHRLAPREPRRLGRRPVLDGLRGIAVLLVISQHTGIVRNGYVGVDVFFVLSGFLITTLLLEEWERHTRISLREFYARRARRLAPALGLLGVLAVVVDVCCVRLTGWGIGLKLTTTFTFVNNWVAELKLDGGNALGALNPTWSLAQEEQFYLLWPLLLMLLLRIGLAPSTILALLAVAISGLLLIVDPFLYTHIHGYSYYYSPVDRGAELLLGCAGAVAWRHRLVPLPGTATIALAGTRGRRALVRRLAVEVVLVALSALFLALYLGAPEAVMRPIFLDAAFLTLPALVLLLQMPNTLVGRAVGCAPLRAVGRVSYCLYLIHLLVRTVLQTYIPGMNPYEVAATTMAVSLPLSFFSLRYLETPIRTGRRHVRIPAVRGTLAYAGESSDHGHRGPAPHAGARPIRSSA